MCRNLIKMWIQSVVSLCLNSSSWFSSISITSIYFIAISIYFMKMWVGLVGRVFSSPCPFNVPPVCDLYRGGQPPPHTHTPHRPRFTPLLFAVTLVFICDIHKGWRADWYFTSHLETQWSDRQDSSHCIFILSDGVTDVMGLTTRALGV